ncbi:YihY/virulence factor BrkB family protein [Paraglaciecola sp.]|uniref:YihY/virulence factor BrkB family protein n=1 Tax=Paraglaciecola sp. TaxID=1920173 RepID=UPI00273EC7A3|nr:YihY/virulence factor BrkB family protein [Paraglaciecola sp.]MDP5032852.1 YihY/virulence factor BrkB family protein [Paraglaciecola sp.]
MSHTRGQVARSPHEFPLLGWWDILQRTVKKMLDDNLSLIAAGVGFYFLLAVFPMIAALVSVYGLVVSPDELQQQMAFLVGFIPEQSRDIIESQIERIMGKSEAALSTGVIISISFAVWSASKGAQAMITACNITYGQKQKRGFLMKVLMRLVFTLSAVLILALALFCIAVMPLLFNYIGLKHYTNILVQWLTWPFLAIMFNLALSSFYRYGPHRHLAKWRWVTPGAILASTMWIAFSFGFSFYLTQFAHYDKTYGSLGSVVVLLMWFYLSAYIILFGAEFNAAMEHQTLEDSTTGREKEMGQRGAFVADTIPDDLQKHQQNDS